MATRRTILKASVVTGGAAVFSGVLGGLNAIAKNALHVRRSLHGMALDDPDLETYRAFVGLMQARDQNKPVSWLGYSLLHGSYTTGEYKYCPHGDWYFLPWHRAYVLMYENAVRALTKNPNFAMPFWDWSLDRTMPSAFTDRTYKGKANPLYVSTRTLHTKYWPLSDETVGPKVMQSIYRETDYQLFGTSRNAEQDNLDMKWVVAGGGTQGTLERNPHNNIHNWIGGYMPTAGSPRDPIFMMHHSNIDRIWATWNALGRSNTATMSASDKNLWLNMVYKNNYMSPDGKLYSVVSKDMQNNVALGYTYPDLPKPDGVKIDEERTRRLLTLFASGESIKELNNLHILSTPNLTEATLTNPLKKEVRISSAMQELVTNEKLTPEVSAEVFALIKDIQVDADVEGLRVFVNAENISADTPNSDPHFVEHIGFLKHGGDNAQHEGHGKVPPSVLVDLTATLRNLYKLGLIKDDKISVHLIPVLRPGAEPLKDTGVSPAVVEIAIL